MAGGQEDARRCERCVAVALRVVVMYDEAEQRDWLGMRAVFE